MTQPKGITPTGAANKPSTPRSYMTASFKGLFPSEIDTVVGYSLNGDDWSFERLDLVPGMLKVDRGNKRIKFSFIAVGGDDPGPHEAIIRNAGDSWVFKADYWDEPATEYPLQFFESPDSILFVFNGKIDHLYFHVDKAV